MKKLILFAIISIVISSCGGGGGNSCDLSDNTNQPVLVTDLVPLNVSTTDLKDNPMPIIDISLIGSHVQYKLKFTNPNSVAVTVPSPDLPIGSQMSSGDEFSDENWLFSEAGVESISTADDIYYAYAATQNPGIGYISDNFIKTSNPDDCFNVKSIEPGGSCSFYAYAYNIGMEYVKESDTFSYPVAYVISTVDKKTSLVVQQCTYSNHYSSDVVSYNCSNESKPSYKSQFITYKMYSDNPGNTNVDIMTGNYGSAISYNGNWLYNCPPYAYPAVCNKYSLTYNPQAITLTQSATPTVIPITSSIGIEDIYPTVDGSSAWVSRFDNQIGFILLNTANPSQDLTAYCFNNTPCVPNIQTTPHVTGIPTGIIGGDGSFWWTTDVSADVYIPSQGTFVQTNIPAVAGVNPDGVAIRAGYCYRPTSNPAVYTEQVMANYVSPPGGVYYLMANRHAYIQINLYGFVDALGQAINTPINAWYKVHTENNLCELRPDDYSINPGGEINNTAQYAFGSIYRGQVSGNASVIPASNIYYGQ